MTDKIYITMNGNRRLWIKEIKCAVTLYKNECYKIPEEDARYFISNKWAEEGDKNRPVKEGDHGSFAADFLQDRAIRKQGRRKATRKKRTASGPIEPSYHKPFKYPKPTAEPKGFMSKVHAFLYKRPFKAHGGI